MRKKKIQTKNSEISEILAKMSKTPKFVTIDFEFRKIKNLHCIIRFFVKMVIEDIPSVFFFSEKVGGGKKKYRTFHSLTPFLRFSF